MQSVQECLSSNVNHRKWRLQRLVPRKRKRQEVRQTKHLGHLQSLLSFRLEVSPSYAFVARILEEETSFAEMKWPANNRLHHAH